MNPLGCAAVITLVLSVSIPAAAQQPTETGKHVASCLESKEKMAGISELAESKYIPVRSTAGDLNADGREEGIVLVRYVGTSGPRPDEILIYEGEGKFVRLLTRLQVGRAGEYVLSIKSFDSNFIVKNGLLFIDLAVLGDKNTESPKLFRTVEYRWDGKGLAESDRSEPKLLPEHMREIG